MSTNDPPIATGDWNVEGQETDSKGGVPKWVLGCGCGCLVMILLAVAAVFVGGRYAASNFTPEKQWEELSSILPYSEQPANLVPVEEAAPIMGVLNKVMEWSGTGMSMVTMRDKQAGLIVILLEMDLSVSNEKGAGNDLDQAFEPQESDAADGVERGFYSVQGKQVPYVFGMRDTGSEFMARFGQQQNDGTLIDLSEGEKMLLFIVNRDPHTPREEGLSERVTEAEVQALLAPFQVWDRP